MGGRSTHATADGDHGGAMREARQAALARDRGVRRVLIGVLVLNLIVAVSKLAVGLMIGALSLVADGIHSLLDASSNIVGLVGMAVASRPPDASHPYGHRRFETLAALTIGVLITVGLVEILHQIVDALTEGHTPPTVTVPAAAFVAATVVVNLFISRYEARRGRELRSALLTADAGHTMSDALAALSVLVGFGGVALGVPWADLAAAAVVCVLIGVTAWRILLENIAVLTDHAQMDPLHVHETATAVEGVRGAHMVRSRGAADWVQLDLHIQVEPGLTVADAHEKTHEVANAIRDRFPEVKDIVIHTEPADGHQHESPIAPPAEPPPKP